MEKNRPSNTSMSTNASNSKSSIVSAFGINTNQNDEWNEDKIAEIIKSITKSNYRSFNNETNEKKFKFRIEIVSPNESISKKLCKSKNNMKKILLKFDKNQYNLSNTQLKEPLAVVSEHDSNSSKLSKHDLKEKSPKDQPDQFSEDRSVQGKQNVDNIESQDSLSNVSFNSNDDKQTESKNDCSVNEPKLIKTLNKLISENLEIRSSSFKNADSLFEKNEQKSGKIFLFDLKQNIAMNLFSTNNDDVYRRSSDRGDSIVDKVYLEHKYYDTNYETKKICNPKISNSLFRDTNPKGISKKPTINQINLKRTNKLQINFQELSDKNKNCNDSFLITFLKVPYVDFQDLQLRNFLQKDIVTGSTLPTRFEIGLGKSDKNFQFQLGFTHADHRHGTFIKYEDLAEYIPVYIKNLDEHDSNDDIIENAYQELKKKRNEINQNFIQNLNTKFPVSNLTANILEKLNFEEEIKLSETNDQKYPQLILFSYQILDEKLEPLSKETIEANVRLRHAFLRDSTKGSIKKAIEEAIGHYTESYFCNYYKRFAYIILIKTPKANLNDFLTNETIIENVTLINDPDFNSNKLNLFKTFELNMKSKSENAEFRNVINMPNNNVIVYSSQLERENFSLNSTKKHKEDLNLKKSKFIFSTFDAECYKSNRYSFGDSNLINKNNENSVNEAKIADEIKKEKKNGSPKMTETRTSKEKFEQLRSKFESKA